MKDTARKIPAEPSITRPDMFIEYIMNERGVHLEQVPQLCIISHSQGILDMACANFSYRTIDLGARRPLPVHFFGNEETPDFAIVACPLGAPMAAVLLEELMALGFESFVAVGVAGHPAGKTGPKLSPGDLVLVNGAMIYEGTSNHYHPGITTSYPDHALTSQLNDILERAGIPFHTGAVATTDALYRETASFLHDIIERGATIIDMELSALFTVSEFYQKKLAALVYVSDIIRMGTNDWQVAFTDEKIDEAEKLVYKALLNLLEGS